MKDKNKITSTLPPPLIEENEYIKSIQEFLALVM